MDELELLKKHWDKEDEQHKPLSSRQIYPMLLKKSSSIVKTLFYISVAELIFWILLNFLPLVSSEYSERVKETLGNPIIYLALTVFTFAIIFLFIYLLYRSYKSISVTDSAKMLMRNILRTRKIIKYYVIYNLTMIVLSIPISMYVTLKSDPKLTQTIEQFSATEMLVFVGFILFITIVFVIIFWLFYRLLYGILLKRLNKNYKELEKLEV